MQHKVVYCCASSLYMFRVSTTPIIRSTRNCNYSLLNWSRCAVQLPPSNVATLELGSCTKNINNAGGCSYSFVYS